MPRFLEDKLKRQYPGNPHAVYGTLNALGMMHGNKETAKGKAAQAQHERDTSSSRAGSHPHRNLGHFLHPRKS